MNKPLVFLEPVDSISMIDKITAYENGEMDDYQMIEFFQELVSSGLIHSLQGSYQRAAQQLIDSGLITPE